jgi:hypothetical protein
MVNSYHLHQNEKAKVCADNICVTVYGDTARIVNGIGISVAALMVLLLLEKAFR